MADTARARPPRLGQGARALRRRRRPPAAGRLRPHLGLRRRPADADPRQGPRADRRSRCSGSSAPATSSPTTSSPRELEDFPEGARDPELAGRAMLVRRLEMLPLECVVRGYLAGSGWKDYARDRRRLRPSRCPRGCARPTGCPSRSSRRRRRPTSGHDENITADAGASSSSASERYAEVERRLASRSTSARPPQALERGIIIADTKFEFGLDERRRARARRRGR